MASPGGRGTTIEKSKNFGRPFAHGVLPAILDRLDFTPAATSLKILGTIVGHGCPIVDGYSGRRQRLTADNQLDGLGNFQGRLLFG
jgi:hypothetical protein